MIEVKVVFDKDEIIVNDDFSIIIELGDGFKDEHGKLITQVLEEAIRYCMEQSNANPH